MRWLWLSAGALGLVWLNGCGTAVTPVRMVIATDATFAPMESLDGNGRPVGFDIDLMRAIAAHAGLEVTFVDVRWEQIFVGLRAGRYAAVISSVTITPDRQQLFDFSTPYLNAGQVVLVRAGETRIHSQADLPGRRVGAIPLTTSAAAVQAISGAVLVPYADSAAAVADLLAGRIDAVVNDSPVAAGYVNGEFVGRLQIAGAPFTSEQYGIVVRRGDAATLALLNSGLAAALRDGSVRELRQLWGLPD